jgi:enoyl-CoA hydratase/carnithine racemase
VAKDLVFTGRVVGMQEAADIGLLNRTAAEGEAESVAIELATAIAAQSASGVRVLKQMFRDLDESAHRVEHENALLMEFQRTGSGLPRG